jgi:dipeptide/tripeptide permease
MFKPCISPTLLDQMPLTEPVTKELDTGEKVIVDPDATTERVMLWFYLLINVGGFVNTGTTYAAKYVGYWFAFFIPLILYMPLPFLLWYLQKRLILLPPGGSDLGWALRILGVSFRRGGLIQMFKRNGDFFRLAKPSVIAAEGSHIAVPWTDEFVEDVRRAFQACTIFMFFPIQNINDNGLGQAANIQSNMLVADGVPNDLLSNFNSLIIIIVSPILNYLFYPWLRTSKIHYGPIARITTGLFISTIGGLAYTIINYYGYKTSPCGNQGTNDCNDPKGDALVSTVSLWWQVVPYALGGLSELFVNVPAYGLAYSRAPKNMRGLVASINLFSAGLANAIGLACSKVVTDPYLTW